jgi:hypothetical protein
MAYAAELPTNPHPTMPTFMVFCTFHISRQPSGFSYQFFVQHRKLGPSANLLVKIAGFCGGFSVQVSVFLFFFSDT